MGELHDLAAWEQADRIRSGDLRATELLEHYLARIEEGDGALNAFCHLDREAAQATARDVDAAVASGEDPGKWAGVPVAIKELADVAGWPSEQGSLAFRGNVADHDGHEVAHLRRAGAVFVGKTTASEFGSVAYTRTKLHGVTRNPWNHDRTPGGSSGGSAAAVSAGLVPIASASDGGGSTRIPASFTGLFGLKPTFGRIPTGPDVPSITQTAVLGCVSRTVRDAARWLDVTAHPAGTDYLSLPERGGSWEADLGRVQVRGLRAAWSPDLGYAVVDPEVREVAEAAAMALVDAAGLELVDRTVAFGDAGPAWGVINTVDIARELGHLSPEEAEMLTPVVRSGLDWARSSMVGQLGRAMEVRYRLQQAVAALFEDVDILLTPTTPNTAFAAEGPMPTEIAGRPCRPTMTAAFTIPFNLAGNAAASVPAGLSGDALPVGLQIVGRRFDEDRILELSQIFEQVRPWPHRARPPGG